MADEKPPETVAAGQFKVGNAVITASVPAGMGFMYSDFITVQSTSYEYIISFFQIDVPFLDPQAAEEFDKNPRLHAHCIGRMAVPLHAGDMLLSGLQSHRQRLVADGTIKEQK